jgi:hypothetical protein
MKSNKFIGMLAVFAIIAGVSLAGSASAQSSSGMEGNGWGGPQRQGSIQGGMMRGGQGRGILGTVSSVSGNTITVNVAARKGFGTSTQATAVAAATYTIDASGATVYKNNATSSVSNIVSGDTVMVQGTVSGTNVTAKVIRDGKMPMENFQKGNRATSTEQMISGDGNPVVAGTVSAISGNTITLKNNSNTQYTVDASSADIKKGEATSSVSSISIGDNILVQGTVNGSSVTATMVIDQSAKPGNDNNGGRPEGGVKVFFGKIGGFFMHLFGF